MQIAIVLALQPALLSALGTDGKTHRLDQGLVSGVVVVRGCPIARKYSPEIERIRKIYSTKGIRFFMVFSEPQITSAMAQKHLLDFGIVGLGLLDADLAFARRFDIRSVPAAFVLRNGEAVYIGRIDDRHVRLGSRRPPRNRDFISALNAVLKGKEPNPSRTEVIGCTIEIDD